MYNYRLRSTIDARFESHVLDMLFCPCWCISLAFGRAINCPSVTNSFVHLNLTLVVPVISVNSTHLYCYLSALVSWSFLKTCLINSSRFVSFADIVGTLLYMDEPIFEDQHTDVILLNLVTCITHLEKNWNKMVTFSLASNMPHA